VLARDAHGALAKHTRMTARYAGRSFLAGVVLLLHVCGNAQSNRELLVAAAADLRPVLAQLVTEFEETTSGLTVKAAYGSSGNLTAQILNGAPYDLFLSADADYPRAIMERGGATTGSQFNYAYGQIVLWVPEGSPVDISRGPESLLQDNVKRVAIADPRHAPYGRTATAWLRGEGVYEQLKPKLILADNVSQAAHFAQTRNVDAALIAESLVAAPSMRGYHVRPLSTTLYPPLQQTGLILGRTKMRDAAEAFRDFLLGPVGQKILSKYFQELPKFAATQ
jgi:molybdate transport system substrate-binding protein